MVSEGTGHGSGNGTLGWATMEDSIIEYGLPYERVQYPRYTAVQHAVADETAAGLKSEPAAAGLMSKLRG